MIAVYNKRKDFLFDQDQRNERERGKKKTVPIIWRKGERIHKPFN